MKRTIFFICTLLLGLLFVTPKQNTAHAQQSDLQGMEVAVSHAFLQPGQTSVQAATIQHGFLSWYSLINNMATVPVTNATVSFMSGLDPTIFGLSTFPYVDTFASLAPGETQFAGRLQPNDTQQIPVNFSLGYDSTKTVSPIMIPVGGTQQTVTITITPIDPGYAVRGPAGSAIHIGFNTNVPGVTVTSATYDPANINQGEHIDTSQDKFYEWHLFDPNINKTYTFTAVFHIPNPYGIPFEFQPEINVNGDRQTLICNTCAGPTVTVHDPTLDGSVPGSGAVTFSVAETNHSWLSKHSDMSNITFLGTPPPEFNLPTSKDQCKKGGWQNYGIFKNQGDCVSFVSTHGKNPPTAPF
jgi:hypothetical protein